MNVITSTSPIDANVADSLVREANSAAFRNKAIGIGAGIGIGGLALSIGIAAMVWANNQRVDLEMLKAALASLPTLKVEGTVKAEGDVKLADGGAVKLEEGGTVKLADGSTVTVKGTVPAQAPAVLPKQKSDDDPAIRTTVTIFKTVTHGDGEITSGWTFASGNAKSPSGQYCYYIRPTGDGNSTRQNVAKDSATMVTTTGVSPEEQAVRFQKCQWWSGGPV